MNHLRFIAMPTENVRILQQTGRDANGQQPEQQLSNGDGIPCRHCLTEVAAGEPYLILAYCPFPKAQPYAEMGPIFLHAGSCARYGTEGEVPPIFLARDQLLLRGYNAQDRIVYGTGQIVKSTQIEKRAREIFTDPTVVYIHVRSASNNCYLCRVERG